MSIKCHKCGSLNEGDFCLNCGSDLRAQSGNVKNCPACNTPLPQGNRFCQSCGYETKEEQMSEEVSISYGGTTPTFQETTSQANVLEHQKRELAKQIASGAGWFYYVAGLSIISTILLVLNTGYSFYGALTVTLIISVIGAGIGVAGSFIAFCVSAVITGICALFGLLCNKRKKWAFIVGMILLGLDGLLLLLLLVYAPLNTLVDIGIRIFALYSIFKGFMANKKLEELEKELNPLNVSTTLR